MRFPSVGNTSIPAQEKVTTLSVKEDLELVNNKIAELSQKIETLDQDLNTNLSDSEKEQVKRKIITAKIDLVEAQTARQFLLEELPQ